MDKVKVYKKINSNVITSYMDATGIIPHNMTNDYMFRIVLQECEEVLIALICALLHMKASDVKEVEILNPIKPGENIEDKEFILDIKIKLNNNTYINLEMQVVNSHNWVDRSLSYLCRAYDQLYHGQDYAEARPAIHIGFLDYTLFQEHKEFYGIYKMFNEKDHYLFSDKLTLGVVDLTQIKLATEEDKAYGIDHWANLFKANTWEELKVIAEGNKAMQEASQALFEFTADPVIRQKCRDREELNRVMRTLERDKRELEEAIAEKDRVIAEKDSAIAEKEKALSEEQEENAHLRAILEQHNIKV